jgi:hypothetical protein
MNALLGNIALLSIEQGRWEIPVLVQDARQVYSRVHCLVAPTGGMVGEPFWAAVDRLREAPADISALPAVATQLT